MSGRVSAMTSSSRPCTRNSASSSRSFCSSGVRSLRPDPGVVDARHGRVVDHHGDADVEVPLYEVEVGCRQQLLRAVHAENGHLRRAKLGPPECLEHEVVVFALDYQYVVDPRE